jgi:hypothetical protein
MIDTNFLVKQFLETRRTPEETRKELLEAGFEPGQVEDALREFKKLAGKRKYLIPPYLVGDETRGSTWYPGGDELPDARFWPALRSHLIGAKGWETAAVDSIASASDKIVAWLESPWAAQIRTRGLVVGYVQSGKTANFTAVIAKAADAGYRFFIVLAGTKVSLRSQTQQRLENELVQLNSESWFSPTTNHEFKPIGNPNYFLADKQHDKVLCVIKKNATVLRKLIEWLSAASPDTLRRCPFLIIDDEADEASINTARGQTGVDPDNYNRTAINRLLVTLLRLLPKAAYVGYTATPFANVLIDPRSDTDLYPRDFIMALPKPEGHFGTERIFGRERLLQDDTDEEFKGVDMVRIVPVEEVPLLKPGGLNHNFTPQLTSSVAGALRYFWLATAARWARGDKHKDSTMLVHLTQLVAVHERAREVIDEYRRTLLNELKGQHNTAILTEFAEQWDIEMERVHADEFGCIPVHFETLRQHLIEVIDKSLVVVDNSRSQFRLSFDEKPKIQIAVGGNTLSRGLTLEGLVVSFFVRSANAYDTLLQMGRWFGYRPNYGDLPRIWMTSELRDLFYDLATIEAEIREEFEQYSKERSITPLEVGARIRLHPDLSITAPLKMQHAVDAQVSYGGTRGGHVQTVLFQHLDKSWLETNLRAASQLTSQLQSAGLQPTEFKGHQIYYGASSSQIQQFFKAYNFHPNNRSLSSELLVRYIEDQNKHGQLKSWNVVIRGVTSRDKKERGRIQLGPLNVPLLERARRPEPVDYAHIGVLMSKGDTGADIDFEETPKLSESEIKELRQEKLPGIGLLVIYPIAKDSMPGAGAVEKRSLNAVEHVIGLGIVVPAAAGTSRGAQNYVTVDPSLLSQYDIEIDEEESEEA